MAAKKRIPNEGELHNILHSIHTLADKFESIQRLRISAENQIRAVKQGYDITPAVVEETDTPYVRRLKEIENELIAEMEIAVALHPLHDFLMGFPGINRRLECRILGLANMQRRDQCTTFSQLRSFAGYAPGKDKLVKRQKATFSNRLKKAVHVGADCVLKCGALMKAKNPPYGPDRYFNEIYNNWRKIYIQRHGCGPKGRKWLERRGFTDIDAPEYKAYVEKKEDGRIRRYPEWPDPRQHLMAFRKVKDVLLYFIWEEWRNVMGFEAPELYVHEKLGHHMKYEAREFRSEELAQRKIAKIRGKGLTEEADPDPADAAGEFGVYDDDED